VNQTTKVTRMSECKWRTKTHNLEAQPWAET